MQLPVNMRPKISVAICQLCPQRRCCLLREIKILLCLFYQSERYVKGDFHVRQ
jgi:hypothetical protein